MSNIVHRTAIIEDGAEIGEGNHIHPHVIIKANVSIGDNNEVFPFSCIGYDGEDSKSYKKRKSGEFRPSGQVHIGNNNIFREHTVIHASLTSVTSIQHRNFFMHGTHVGHDAKLESDIVLSPYVVIGGYSFVGSFANIGINASIHQRLAVGPLTMVGMQSPITKSLLPGTLVFGNPSRYRGLNVIGIERAELSVERIQKLIQLDLEDWEPELNEAELNVGLGKFARMYVEGSVRKLDFNIGAIEGEQANRHRLGEIEEKTTEKFDSYR
jgi:UDP-N-acetylglucosamine acyltransferase